MFCFLEKRGTIVGVEGRGEEGFSFKGFVWSIKVVMLR
jgi:hypothetical protein